MRYIKFKMPYRSLGLGIVSAGLMVLTIAMIIGLQFPKYVSRESKKMLCLRPGSGEVYKNWVTDRHRDRLNYLYFWNVINPKFFLYEGAEPKLELRGPYVYRETGTKVAVSYLEAKVTFKEMKTQMFDAKVTAKECGDICKEGEELTIINTPYLAMIGKHGGKIQNVLLWYIPRTLQAIMSTVVTALNPSPNLYAVLGLTSGSTWSSLMKESGLKNISVPSFGAFLAQNDKGYKVTILKAITKRNLTSVEMHGLYDILLSENALGVTSNKMADCDNCTALYKNYKLRISNGVDVVVDQTLLNCGLVFYLERWKTRDAGGSDDEALFSITAVFLCSNVTSSCFVMTSPHRSVFMDALSDYTLHILPNTVLQIPAIRRNLGFFMTRRVKELALGFNVSIGQTKVTFVQGILENHTDVFDAVENAAQITLAGCTDMWDPKDSLQWAAYSGGKRQSAVSQHRSSTNHRINGLYMNHRPVEDLRPCWHYDLAKEVAVPVFVPTIWRTVSFKNERKVLHYGYETRRFGLDRDAFRGDVVTAGDGLQDMSGILNYQAWIGRPHLVDSNSGSNITGEDDSSFVDIEPITGAVWGRKFNFQQYAGVDASLLPELMVNTFNITYTNQPIPVYRLDDRTFINPSGIDHFRDQVSVFMTAACVGLATLTIPACLLVLFGLSVALVGLPSRKRRVQPEQGENSIL